MLAGHSLESAEGPRQGTQAVLVQCVGTSRSWDSDPHEDTEKGRASIMCEGIFEPGLN